MKTLLTLLLLSFSVNADPYIQRLTSEQTGNGYVMQFEQDGVLHCWGMPDMLDQSFIPETWMRVTDAALAYHWPEMTGLAAQACLNGPKIWRTVGGPLYTINHYLQREIIGSVPSGVPCGDPIIRFQFIRAVRYNNQVGFAFCQ